MDAIAEPAGTSNQELSTDEMQQLTALKVALEELGDKQGGDKIDVNEQAQHMVRNNYLY